LKQEEKKWVEIGLKLELKLESKALTELRKWDYLWRKGGEEIKTKSRFASFKVEK
jgi:hypothetical protein